jgi:YfiR/HmsC-like
MQPGRPVRQVAPCVGILLWLALALGMPAAATAADEFAEYQLKAGYLYNFIAYTEWPQSVPSQLQVCVYGSDPFGVHLDALANRKVGERSLAIERLTSVEMADPCQVIFVSSEAISNIDRLQEAIGHRPVLLVADTPGAISSVTINMLEANGRVEFQINLEAARHHGLNLSFQLLKLAREVVQ